MQITKNDVGRQIIDRFGNPNIIIAFVEGQEFPVITESARYKENGHYKGNVRDYDLIEFLAEEINLDISKKDVGRKVFTKYNTIEDIVEFREDQGRPIITNNCRASYTPEGIFLVDKTLSKDDVIRFYNS